MNVDELSVKMSELERQMGILKDRVSRVNAIYQCLILALLVAVVTVAVFK